MCGAISITLVALVPATHTHKRAGIMAGLLLVFLPGFWLHSEIALSDIPGITCTLCSAVVFLLNVHVDHLRLRYFIAGAFFAGLSLGVRPHNAIPIVMAGLLALYGLRPFNLKFQQHVTLGIIAGLIGMMIWLIPIYQAFDGYQGYQGLDGYFRRIEEHSQHVQSSDSLFQQDITVENINLRIADYVDGWSHLLAGKNSTTFMLMIGLMLVGIIRLPIKQRLTWLLLIWFVAEAAKIFLIVSLERPRLYLPALIPLIMLVALGYSQWQGHFRFVQLGFIGLIMLSAFDIPPPHPETQFDSAAT